MKFIIGIAVALPLLGYAQCSSGLFFSEYVEGSGNNKAIELYNGTTRSIDLTNYVIEIYFNGNTSPAHTKHLIGVLAPADIHVLALNNASDATLTAKANQLDSYAFSWFNGNDALVLKEVSTNSIIDVIGEVGVDPGEYWRVDTGGTKDHTLVRKSHITNGNTDWQSGQGEWDVYPLDYFNDLGAHTFDCALPISFSDIHVERKNFQNVLTWCLNEKSLGRFSILHSIDGVEFYVMDEGYIQSINSNVAQYSYVHNNPYLGLNYYQIVFQSEAGVRVYSPIVSDDGNVSEIKIFYDREDGELLIEGDKNAGIEIYVSDALGRNLFYREVEIPARIPLPSGRIMPISYIRVTNREFVKVFTVLLK